MRMVICTTEKWNGHLENILDVDLKITQLLNFQSHQKLMRNGESKYFFMKKVIVHTTTLKITVTRRYMNISHVCLVMTNVLVEILVTVPN